MEAKECKQTKFFTKSTFIVILSAGSALAAGGCATTHRMDHPVAREAIRQGSNSECFRIKDKDLEMRDAVLTARKTVHSFIKVLKNPSPTQRDFEVKKRFAQGSEKEHIWLSDVTFNGTLFYGKVDNTPIKMKGIKLGDRVSVNPTKISDWAYVDNGNLVGGYTIRVLYNELSPQRRKELEHENRFHITSQ
jgi:uncharacterized protein YegJ (DUF2314 family)